MIQICQMKIPVTKWNSVQEEIQAVQKKCAAILKISENELFHFKIDKKSIDARKKPDLFFIYSAHFSVKSEKHILKKCKNKNVIHYEEKKYIFPTTGDERMDARPVIVGMGPAGLFCAYMLAKHGYAPVIYERGKKVEERMEDVQNFWDNGKLLLHSNVQFGEGGAGTFSDGKLNTLVKDSFGRNKEVLKIFVECGAPEEILYENKAHIGTDLLMTVVKNMREKILEMGAEIHYKSQVTDFFIINDKLEAIEINHKEKIPVSVLVLAIGHSARDSFQTLYERKVPMAAKDFAVGFRVQHPQKIIDQNQYGRDASFLPSSSYKLATKTSNGRSVYSFCMCPGGYVVNASSEEEATVVNGMSYSGRNSAMANSAIIVSVTTRDYLKEKQDIPDCHPLSGIYFQRELEHAAFLAGKGKIPIQYFDDFCNNSKSEKERCESPISCIKGAYQFANLREILPDELNQSFIEGMHLFANTINEFDNKNCVMAAVESRTSSPVRIHRNSQCESEISGIYPCGEGAGYAGGITSAAMDGLFVAESIAKKFISVYNI